MSGLSPDEVLAALRRKQTGEPIKSPVPGMSGDDFATQMQQGFEMLDHLAETDMEAYKAFVKKNLEGGLKRKPSIVPTPGFVVKAMEAGFEGKSSTNVKLPAGASSPPCGKVFINVCSHKGIDGPVDKAGHPIDLARKNTDNVDVPVLVGPLRGGVDGNGAPAKAIDVIVHPWVTERAAESPGLGFQNDVATIAVQWVMEETNLKLSRRWQVMRTKYKCGADGKQQPVTYFPSEEILKGAPKKGGDTEEATPAAPAPADTRDGVQGGGAGALGEQAEAEETDAERVLRKMGLAGASGQPTAAPSRGDPLEALFGAGHSGTPGGEAGQTMTAPKKRPMITVVGGDDDEEDDSAKLVSVKITESASEGTVTFVARLQGVESMGEVDLEVSRTAVQLRIGVGKRQHWRLPREVLDTSASAKFSKKKSKLKVTMQVA